MKKCEDTMFFMFNSEHVRKHNGFHHIKKKMKTRCCSILIQRLNLLELSVRPEMLHCLLQLFFLLLLLLIIHILKLLHYLTIYFQRMFYLLLNFNLVILIMVLLLCYLPLCRIGYFLFFSGEHYRALHYS